jgi:hypothetical protein
MVRNTGVAPALSTLEKRSASPIVHPQTRNIRNSAAPFVKQLLALPREVSEASLFQFSLRLFIEMAGILR